MHTINPSFAYASDAPIFFLSSLSLPNLPYRVERLSVTSQAVAEGTLFSYQNRIPCNLRSVGTSFFGRQQSGDRSLRRVGSWFVPAGPTNCTPHKRKIIPLCSLLFQVYTVIVPVQFDVTKKQPNPYVCTALRERRAEMER